MHYSKFLLALPAANAMVVARDAQPDDEVVQYAYTTVVQTVVVTEGAQPAATQVHDHAQYHSAAPVVTVQPSAPAQPPAQPPPPPPQSPAPAPAPQQGSGGPDSCGGCPPDTSGQHMSPGVNGHPDKSMIDSINYMRRLYNPNANCLGWSQSLASASQTCAADTSESHLRVNSDIVSAPGYLTGNYYTGDLASSAFERSMFWMLCQSNLDPELQGTCSGKTAEAGCSAGACTGHHDAIVDASNTNKFMGCGNSEATGWISCSFSGSDDAPAGY